jgi:DnaA family protein
MRQLALPVSLRTSSVFESFFPGPNAGVVTQLKSLTRGVRPPVIWLYGPKGVGKTHLLQSVCANAGRRGEPSAYLPLRDASVMKSDLLSGCETLSFVCLDDFDAIVGDANWERALFRLYTELEDQGGLLLIAAEGPPVSMSIALRDLASRLAAGTVLRLQPLTDEEQVIALTLRAEQLGLELPIDTANYLIRRLPRDMTSLCDALDALDQASLADQRRLTVPFVRDVIEHRT